MGDDGEEITAWRGGIRVDGRRPTIGSGGETPTRVWL